MVTVDKNKASVAQTHWKNSLTFKFTIIQIIVATLIIASSIWLLFSTEKKHHMETQLSLSQTYAHSVIEQLQNVVAKIDTLANAISIVGETYKDQPQVIKQLVPSLLTVEGTDKLIAGGGIWPEPKVFFENQQGSSLFWARNDTGQYEQVDGYNNIEGAGYHQEDWYRPIKYFQNAHINWSESYVDPYTKELMVTASVPMRSEHNFIGVATVDISLSGLDKHFTFSDQNPLSKGYILALDAYNNLLSDPFDELGSQTPFLGKPLQELLKRFPVLHPIENAINELDDRFYQQAIEHPAYRSEQLQTLLQHTPPQQQKRLTALINSALQSKTTKQDVVTLELPSSPLFDEPVLVSILTMAQTQWKIILVTPVSSLSQQANSIAIKIGSFLLLSQLLALIILFSFQHKLFIRPIYQIVSALQSGNIGKLELDANHRQDEVGQLAKAFISRSNQLEIAYASLDASNLALEQQLEMQRLAQSELETKRELINSLLNASQNIICIKDTDGKYTLVNDKFCEILGIERERILGAKDSNIFPIHVAKMIANQDRLIKESDNAHSFEQPMPTVHGERVFLITKYPIKDADGNTIGLGAMAVDVSSLKEKQAEQEQSIQSLTAKLVTLEKWLEKAKQQASNSTAEAKPQPQLAAGTIELTHQKLMLQMINQLNKQQLAALENLFTVLQTDPSLNHPLLSEKLTEQIDILRRSQPLIKSTQQSKAIILEQYLQDLLTVLAPHFKSKAITCSVDCPKQIAITLPAWQLFTLCYQLINNTVFHAFTEEVTENKDKQLQIKVEQQQNLLKIRVTDNGVGMTSALLEAIDKQLDEQSGYGTLAEINRWLKAEFQGTVSIDSKINQFTTIECQLNISNS
ncbi:PAS domain-containing protein [Shewanella sp. Isolate11]|uniref:PAS domain-containing protein n=1 Tax=Shewanella sp. Isolate11 TaxID=2908530 RepID=UPI001EFD268A|nr:PAS domain-containing protein [Shewanella sp. Isolate11]MCG9696857.1 PAS domain-containing protein [Shewanella sp. Isolate11]